MFEVNVQHISWLTEQEEYRKENKVSTCEELYKIFKPVSGFM